MSRRIFARLFFCLGLIGAVECRGQFTNYAVIYNCGTNSTQGYSPRAALLHGSDGWLYGTTWGGGTFFSGTVYKISTNGTGYTMLHAFADGFPTPTDGSSAFSSLIEDVTGTLYGTTYGGSIYRLNKDGSGYSNIVLSTAFAMYGSLLQGTNRLIYGTSATSGASNLGSVFQLTTNGFSFTNVHSFTGGNVAATSDGSAPEAGLMLASDGQLYGTSVGPFGVGTVFRMAHGGTNYTVLHHFDFSAPADGLSPRASVFEAFDGFLYGTTSSGGTNNAGLIYKMTKGGGSYSVMYRFDITNGATPYHAQLVQTDGGTLYGTAAQSFNNGVVFKIETNGSNYKVLHAFNSTDGANPDSGLLKARDGTFYGTTQEGGTNDGGVIYRMAKPGTRPLFLADIFSQTNYIGSPTIFDPIGLSDTNTFYHWRKNNVPLANHREGVFSMPSTVATNAGTYQVIVSNIFGTATSAVATLVVYAAPAELVYGPKLTNLNFIARYSGTLATNYTVERNWRLTSTNWVKWTNMVAPATDQGFGVGVFQFFVPVDVRSNYFYRVVWPSY